MATARRKARSATILAGIILVQAFRDPNTPELSQPFPSPCNQDGTIDPVERAFGRFDSMDQRFHDRQPR